MNDQIESLINASIKLELVLSELYFLFQTKCEEDKAFWEKLSNEEIEHAEILRKGKGFIGSKKEFPTDIVPKDIASIQKNINQVKLARKKFEKEFDRKLAFTLALKIENSFAEIHYQKFMESHNDSWIANVFKNLNGEDKNHIHRIQMYMKGLDLT